MFLEADSRNVTSGVLDGNAPTALKLYFEADTGNEVAGDITTETEVLDVTRSNVVKGTEDDDDTDVVDDVTTVTEDVDLDVLDPNTDKDVDDDNEDTDKGETTAPVTTDSDPDAGIMPLATRYDTINIELRVCSIADGTVSTIGSSSVSAGRPGYVQSNSWRIPTLSSIAPAGSSYGSVVKVAGNWYFPSGDKSEGTSVQFSTNNPKGVVTYYTTYYSPSGNVNTGGGSNSSGGYGSAKTLHFHANYPNGYDPIYSVSYSSTEITFESNSELLTYALYKRAGFTVPTGYKLKIVPVDRAWLYWWTAPSGGEVSNYVGKYGGSGTEYYAQYEPLTFNDLASDNYYTVQFKDSDGSETFGSSTVAKGDTAVAAHAEKESLVLAGYNTEMNADEAQIEPGEEVTVQSNMVYYAVWDEPGMDYELKFDAYGGTGAPDTMTDFTTTGMAEFTIPDEQPVKTGWTCIGWSETPGSAEPDYPCDGSGTVTLWPESPSKTLYAVYSPDEGTEPDPGPRDLNAEITIQYSVFDSSNQLTMNASYDAGSHPIGSVAEGVNVNDNAVIMDVFDNLNASNIQGVTPMGSEVSSGKAYILGDGRVVPMDEGEIVIDVALQYLTGETGKMNVLCRGWADGQLVSSAMLNLDRNVYEIDNTWLYEALKQQIPTTTFVEAKCDYFTDASGNPLGADTTTNIKPCIACPDTSVNIVTLDFYYTANREPATFAIGYKITGAHTVYAFDPGYRLDVSAGQTAYDMFEDVPATHFYKDKYVYDFDRYTIHIGDGELDDHTAIDAVYTIAAGDNLVVAEYIARHVYTTTYETFGGTKIDPTTETEDGFHISDIIPEKKGYIFKGWALTEDDEPTVTPGDVIPAEGNMTLYAVWEKDGNPILTYDTCGGTAVDPTDAVDGSFMVSDICPEKDGFLFMGWSDNKGGEVDHNPKDVIAATGDKTIYAVWEADENGNQIPDKDETFSIVYKSDVDGDPLPGGEHTDVPYGSTTPGCPEPVRSGFIFKGWSPEVDPTVTEDKVYVAIWEEADPDDGDDTNTPDDGDDTDDPNKGDDTDDPNKGDGDNVDDPDKDDNKGDGPDKDDNGGDVDDPNKGDDTDDPNKGDDTKAPDKSPDKGDHKNPNVPDKGEDTTTPDKGKDTSTSDKGKNTPTSNGTGISNMKVTAPKTGDSTALNMCLLLLSLSAFAIAGITVYRKKK